MSDALKRKHEATLPALREAVRAPYGKAIAKLRAAGLWDETRPQKLDAQARAALRGAATRSTLGDDSGER